MQSFRFAVMVLCLTTQTVTALRAQDDDELVPGLHVTYSASGIDVSRVDGDIAFDWQQGSPDLRLPSGPFQARWDGYVLLREEGKYRFHAFLQGTVVIRVNGQIVLEGNSETPAWVSGEPVDLGFGEMPLAIEYLSTGTGRLWLGWSSETFPLEPLPHHSLFHDLSDAQPELIPAGALAVLQHRCDRCHGELAGLKSPPGPSLLHIGTETSRAWLLDQIQHGGGEHGRMPQFDFSRTDAEAILAALQADVKPLELAPSTVPAELVEKDIAAGRELLISTGCLACHTWDKQGRAGEFGGPALDNVGQHRSATWIEHWLRDPAQLNAQHRMPVFTLTDTERRQITSALTAPHTLAVSQPAVQSTPALLTRGKKLLEESRCAHCHDLPGPQRELIKSVRWPEMKLTDDGCWAATNAKSPPRPQYAKVDAATIRDFVSSAFGRDIQPAADLRGAQLLLEKGCVNCHDRDGRKGISALAADMAQSHPTLQGRAPWLIPPQLTAVGDRLPDERLSRAIRGELPTRRLDWLLVRMPKYQHTDAEQTALLSHLVGHDRIPDHAPATPQYPRSDTREMTLAGRELIGGKGFSCVACHPVKDFQPKQVALGTRGSNLFEIGQRLRPEYFFRWTRSPLRVMPGVEMPSYQRPHAVIFPGDLNTQLASIWTALNDPDLPTPVNPGAVEQYWTVGPNDAPRILRDVVTLPGKKKETVPRAFAVGFPNGHNVLFDLDTASVRAWTVGDFAQQRTQGKSWFWDLVGTPVMVNENGESDFQMIATQTKRMVFPSQMATIRLQHVRSEGNEVHLIYEIAAPLDEQKSAVCRVRVGEVWQPGGQGWRRRVVLLQHDPSQADVSFKARTEGTQRKAERFDLYQIDDVHNTRIKLKPGESVSVPFTKLAQSSELELFYASPSFGDLVAPPVPQIATSAADEINAVPGFRGRRLPYPTNIMPTAMTFDRHGKLLFTSLKGHVYRGDDHAAKLFAEGLAAPFGILDSHDMVLVAHKPEIVGLVDEDEDGRADQSTVIATGWGLSDDYHDWTCGLVRDREGNLFTTLGSDYAMKDRPLKISRWRGDALKIDPEGHIESIARGLRFPTGVAMTADQHIFITDQQGVQNTFNELNWLQPGARFGVPSLHEPDKEAPSLPPAVQIPHPWTRSVNGITAIPKSFADRTHPQLFDQLLGCEYDTRFLVRFSHQLVDGVMQGAAYPFSKPVGSAVRTDGSNAAAQTVRTADPTAGFLGPLSIAVSPEGDLYVGSIHDSGWQGGLNTGDIVKLSPAGEWPNGLAEIRVTPAGFDLEFFHPVDKSKAEEASRYQISGYTRVWQGSYATPDSGRHSVEVQSARLNAAGTVVSLTLHGLKPGNVYDVVVGEITTESETSLWPSIGHYTLHKLPK